MNQAFHPAFDMPTTPARALAVLEQWGNPECKTFGHERAARIHELLRAVQPAQHPDDAAVDRFAVAMKEKMAASREKGRSGWGTCLTEVLQEKLVHHVIKGDPRDVANFCMMLWNRGERTKVEHQWIYDAFGYWPLDNPQPTSQPIILNVIQLHRMLEFIGHDTTVDVESLQTEITLKHLQAHVDSDGADAPAGLYCCFTEHPDEGCLYLEPTLAEPVVTHFNLISHLYRQVEFSQRTFGPGMRTQGVVDRIRKELIEVLANPQDLSEWIDVAILALDGAWRTGATPEQIIAALVTKQTKNEGRQWPDWRTMPADQAIEHVRTVDAPNSPGPQYPATFLVNTVNGPTYACMQHARALRAVFGLLGAGTMPMPLDDDDQHECENCINEATARGAA